MESIYELGKKAQSGDEVALIKYRKKKKYDKKVLIQR